MLLQYGQKQCLCQKMCKNYLFSEFCLYLKVGLLTSFTTNSLPGYSGRLQARSTSSQKSFQTCSCHSTHFNFHSHKCESKFVLGQVKTKNNHISPSLSLTSPSPIYRSPTHPSYPSLSNPSFSSSCGQFDYHSF